jgi:hypothetical protein
VAERLVFSLNVFVDVRIQAPTLACSSPVPEIAKLRGVPDALAATDRVVDSVTSTEGL